MSWDALEIGGDEVYEQWQALEVQLLFEVLLVLAFGRTIVIPQPYAFDSLPLLSVARETLSIRNNVSRGRRHDRPIRLSVFYQDGFDAALGRLIKRISDTREPFRSSLFPELHKLKPSEIAAVASDLDLLRKYVPLEDEWGVHRLDALHMMRQEFGQLDAPTFEGKTNGPLPLNRILRELQNGRPHDGANKAERETYGLLREGAAAWLGRAPEADHRSWLHTEVWPGKERLTPAQAVGGDEIFAPLREFTDTAYNCLLARSAGVGIGTFTTPPVESESHAQAGRLEAAQRMAIRLFSETFTGTVRDEVVTERAAGDRFALILRPDSLLADRRHTLGDLREQLVDALHEVMKERAKGKSSAFWTSAQKVNSELAAAATGTSVRNAIDAHVDDHVRRLLVGKVEMTEHAGRNVALSISSATGVTVISGALALPLAGQAAVGIGGGIAAEALVLRNVIRSQTAAWRGRKRWRRVLAEAVSFAEHEA